MAGGHVGDHVLDRLLLVRGLLEREGGGKGLVFLELGAIDITAARLALGVDGQQLGGDIANLLLRLALGLLPLARAELVQRRVFRRRAAVAADQVQRGDRHVELVAVLIFQGEKFVFLPAGGDLLQAEIPADAVVDVHHRGADLQLRQMADDVFGLFAARFAPAPLQHLFAEQLALGDDRDAGLIQ